LNRTTSDGEIIDFRKDGSTVGRIGTQGGRLTIGDGATGLRIAADLNTIVPWNTTTNVLRDAAIDLGQATQRFKDLYLSGGVHLGGTGSANKLEDYEEGTWTATTAIGSVSPHVTPTYTKIGDLVTIYFDLRSFTETTSGSDININGLPFPAIKRSIGACMFRYWDTSGDGIIAYVDTNLSSIRFLRNSTGQWDPLDYNMSNGSSMILSGTITYKTS